MRLSGGGEEHMNQGSPCSALVPKGGDHTVNITHMLADESKASEATADSMVPGEVPYTGAGSALPSLAILRPAAVPFS